MGSTTFSAMDLFSNVANSKIALLINSYKNISLFFNASVMYFMVWRFCLQDLIGQEMALAFSLVFVFFFKILFIHFYREGKRRKKRGRETSMCGCLSHTPY